MAGFFDSLLNSVDSDPDNEKNRDYRKLSEITTPDELEAYRAGSSATGIPGLDYARSLFRGARKELTEPSMGPMGERFNEVMDEYNRRMAAANELKRRYPEAYRAGRLRGTEAIPGAEAAFMAQPGVAAAASPFVRGAMRSAPAAAEREIAALPAGFDLMERRPTAGSWDALDRLQRTDRMAQPRKSIWPELKLNPHGAPEAPVTPKMPQASDVSSQLTASPSPKSWSDVQPADMNAKVRSILMRVEQGGQPMTSFEQNMVNNYFTSFKNRPSLDMRPNAKLNLASPTMGVHGEVAENVDANIAARQAAEAAKAERFANLPPVLQTNAFYKRANRLLEGAEEAQNFGFGKGRNSNYYRAPDPVILGMEEGAAYKPPPSPNSIPLLAQPGLMDKAMRLSGPAAAAGTGFGVGVLTGKRPQGVEQGPPLPASHASVGAPMPREARGPMASEMRTAPSVAADEGRRPVNVSRPAHRATARPVARRAAPSGEMYYGDYRDLEPFSSDPVGNFIDELTGRNVKRSKTKGSARQGGLGDLLPFERGGSVRSHFEDGGIADIPVLGDIGDALGGLFGEGKTVAQDPESAPAPAPAASSLNEMGPISDFLLAAGLGMMASPAHDPLRAIGEGGIKGLEYYRASRSAQQALREKEQQRAELIRQRKILERLNGPVAEDEGGAEAPVLTTPKTTKSEAAAAPTAEPAVAAGDEAAPEVTKVAERSTAPAATPASSTDAYIKRLQSAHRRIMSAMGDITVPQLRQALEDKEKAIQYELNRVMAEKKAAEELAFKTLQEQRAEEKERREAYERSPEGIRAKTRVETAAKKEQDIVDATNQAATTAESTLNDIDLLEKAYRKGEIHTSPMTQSVLKMFQSYGYEVSPELTNKIINSKSIENTETLQALGVADLMKKIGGSLGTAVSDADRKTIERMAIGLDKSPASNLRMLKTLKTIMQRAQDAREFMIDYQTKNGSLDENYPAALAKHFADKPLFSEGASKQNVTSSDASQGMTDRQRRAAEILREREKAGQ